MKIIMRKVVDGVNTDLDITTYIIEMKTTDAIDSDQLLGNTISTLIDLKLNNTGGVFNGCAGNIFLVDLNQAETTTVPTREFTVQEAPAKYTKQLSLSLYDAMIKFNVAYKSTLNYTTDNYPTIKDQLNEMGSMTGMTIDITNLTAAVLAKQATWIDTSIIMRNYLGWIGEISGTNVFIDSNNSVVFKQLLTTDHTISSATDFEYSEDITFSRVAFDDGVNLIASGDLTGKTIYISSNNSYSDSKDLTDAINTIYTGKSFHALSGMKTFGQDGMSLTDTVTYDGIKCIVMSIKRNYQGASSIVDLNGDVKIKNADSVVTKISDSVKIKRIQTTVDQQNQRLTILAQDTEDNKGSISQLQIDSKNISTNLADSVQGLQSQINQNSSDISAAVQQLDENGEYIDVAKQLLDKDGLHITTSQFPTSTVIDGEGTHVKNGDDIIANFTANGSMVNNMSVLTYLSYGAHRGEYLEANELTAYNALTGVATFSEVGGTAQYWIGDVS